jgi:tetratricopeptide (TPR) repeat protein
MGRQLDGEVDAEPLLRRALAIREQVLGPDHPSVAETLVHLATPHPRFTPLRPPFPTASLPDLERALEIHERAESLDPTQVLMTVNQLTQLMRHPDGSLEIEPLLHRAIALCQRHWGAEHPSLTDSEAALARLYESQGRMDEAEQLLLGALARQDAAFGPEHPAHGTLLHAITGFYRQQRRYAEAEVYQRRLLPVQEANERLGNPPNMYDLIGLADLLALQGKTAEAEALYQDVVVRLREAGKVRDHERAVALRQYAHLLRETGRFGQALWMEMCASEAEPGMHDPCLEARRRVIWPPPHPEERPGFVWIRWLLAGYITERTGMVRWETTSDANLFFAHRGGGSAGGGGGASGREQCQTLQWHGSDTSMLIEAFAASPARADVVMATVVPARPAAQGSAPHLVMTQTARPLGRPNFAEVEVRFRNEGEGDLLRLRLDEIELAEGWEFLPGQREGEAVPLPLHVGRIGPGASGLLLVRMVRRQGMGPAALSLRGSYTDAAGHRREL